MVTVHRAFGFRFVIFTNDHAPPHVHVEGKNALAKIELLPGGGVRISQAIRISRADLRRIRDEAERRHGVLLEAWRRIHGRED